MADLPLTGRRVVVTRATEQAGSLTALLRERGATPIELPTIKIEQPEDWSPLDRALAHLNGYDWAVFTSVNSVQVVAGRLKALGRDLRELQSVRIAAVGAASANALAALGIEVDVVPERFVAEALVSALAHVPLTGRRLFLPQAADARDVVARGLSAQGALVEAVVAYRTCPDGDRAGARAVFVDNLVDIVTFTSSSTVRNLVALLGDDARALLEGLILASIGPITTTTARKLGLTIALEAAEHTVRGLVDAIEMSMCARKTIVSGGRGGD